VRPNGATLVPRHEVVPPGSSFEDRTAEGLREMARSENVAAAVALKQAGYTVRATPRGALVEAVATDAPAARELNSGDVIVGARGRTIRTPEQLRRSFDGVRPGADVVLRIRRSGAVKTVTVRTVASPSEPGRAIIGISSCR
jgi:PDZ domain-containing protein